MERHGGRNDDGPGNGGLDFTVAAKNIHVLIGQIVHDKIKTKFEGKRGAGTSGLGGRL